MSGPGGASDDHANMAMRADLIRRASMMERRELHFGRIALGLMLIGFLAGMVAMALFDWYFYNTPLVGWLR